MCRPGNDVPVTGALVGSRLKGLGGMALPGVVALVDAVLGNANSASRCAQVLLVLLAVEGAESGVRSPLLVAEAVEEWHDDDDDVVVAVVVPGAAPAGDWHISSLGGSGSVMALRNSVYAVGGDIGVLSADASDGAPSSCLMKGCTAESGVLAADSAES